MRRWAYLLLAVAPVPFALLTSSDASSTSATKIPSMERHLAALWVLGVSSAYVLTRSRHDRSAGGALRAVCALIAIWCVPLIYGSWNYLKEIPDFERRTTFWIASVMGLLAIGLFALAPRRPRVEG